MEVSACAAPDRGQRLYGIFVRHVDTRLGSSDSELPPEADHPRSVEQMTELVGQVPLKELVRESTDLIERLCIEAALRLTLIALLAGFRMDVEGRRHAELADTLDYAYHVTGVVGVMMAKVMGVRGTMRPTGRATWASPCRSPASPATSSLTRPWATATCPRAG